MSKITKVNIMNKPAFILNDEIMEQIKILANVLKSSEEEVLKLLINYGSKEALKILGEYSSE